LYKSARREMTENYGRTFSKRKYDLFISIMQGMFTAFLLLNEVYATNRAKCNSQNESRDKI